MSWDWRKALRVDGGSAAPTGKTLSNRQGAPAVANPLTRVGSIAWRSMGMGGYGVSGGLCGQLLMDAQYDCPFCHGRGKVASASVCPVCNGRKKVHVEPPAVKCAFCGGHGQSPPRSGLTCWVCGGKGVVAVAPDVQTCPDCQGRGKKPCESLYCPRCHGVGVAAWRAEAEDRPGVSCTVAHPGKPDAKGPGRPPHRRVA